jgi:hypothetical protein
VLDVQEKSVYILPHLQPNIEKTRFSMSTVLRQPSSQHQKRIAGFQFIGLMGDNE